MDNPQKIILKPLITEKGTLQTEQNNSYNFLVHAKANKSEISKAIERSFEVRVVSVNTMIRKGKRKGLGYRSYRRSDVKRAVVTLAEGDAIEFI